MSTLSNKFNTDVFMSLIPESWQNDIEIFESIPSTNTYLKQYAKEHREFGKKAVIALSQSAGRGRVGRSFSSPDETGIYLSLLFRPSISPRDSLLLTVCAAVCAVRAVKNVFGIDTDIKWVNDIYKSGKKCAGILTEGGLSATLDVLEYAVVGIGFNISPPREGFPEEIRETAGALCDGGDTHIPNARERLAAEFISEFDSLYNISDSCEVYNEYKDRLFILGKEVDVIKSTGEVIPARVTDLLRDYSLLVEYKNSTVEALAAGEVSLKKIR